MFQQLVFVLFVKRIRKTVFLNLAIMRIFAINALKVMSCSWLIAAFAISAKAKLRRDCKSIEIRVLFRCLHLFILLIFYFRYIEIESDNENLIFFFVSLKIFL